MKTRPCRWPRLLWAAGLLIGMATAAAEGAARIESISFLGNRELSASTLQAATAGFVGRPLDAETLAALRTEVQRLYDAAGYGLVTVSTPVAVEGGAVALRVTEFRVSDIQISGGDEAALRRLPALTAGASPQFDRLSRELFLFNDNPRRKAALDFKPDGADRVKAQLSLQQRSPLFGSLALDNSGTEATGRERLRLSLGHADLLGSGVVGELMAVTSTDDSTVRQFMGRASLPVIATGGSVDVSMDHARSDLGPALVFSSISGRSTGGRIGYRHPLHRATDSERFLDAALEQRHYEDVYDFAGFNLGSSVATRPFTLGYSDVTRGRWIVQHSFGITANIPGGGDNEAENYAASRFGADENWLRANAGIGALAGFGGGWQFSARAAGQYSNDALISGEQFRAGGAALLRGLIEGEIAGDSGLALGLELAASWPQPLQVFVFTDAARATRNLSPVGSPSAQSALTAGVGLRSAGAYWAGFELSVGHVLAQDQLPESDEGDTRVHASLRLSF